MPVRFLCLTTYPRKHGNVQRLNTVVPRGSQQMRNLVRTVGVNRGWEERKEGKEGATASKKIYIYESNISLMCKILFFFSRKNEFVSNDKISLSELIGIPPTSDTRKFGYPKLDLDYRKKFYLSIMYLYSIQYY